MGAEQLRKLGEVEDVEEEPVTQRRREYRDLGKRNEHVACHALALALAMTDEAMTDRGEGVNSAI